MQDSHSEGSAYQAQSLGSSGLRWLQGSGRTGFLYNRALRYQQQGFQTAFARAFPTLPSPTLDYSKYFSIH